LPGRGPFPRHEAGQPRAAPRRRPSAHVRASVPRGAHAQHRRQRTPALTAGRAPTGGAARNAGGVRTGGAARNGGGAAARLRRLGGVDDRSPWAGGHTMPGTDGQPDAPGADPAAAARALLTDSFGRIREQVAGLCDGLTTEEASWRPERESNSIGWLL